MQRRHQKLCVAIIAATSLLAGCAQDNTPPPTPLAKTPPKQAGVANIWQRSVGNGNGGHYLMLGPYVADKMIYAISQDGTIAAVNASNGSVSWTITTDFALSTTPVVAKQALYVGTLTGKLVAVDLDQHKVLWSSHLPSTALAPVAVGPKQVVIHTHDGSVSSYNRQTGKQLWRYDGDTPDLSLERDSAPVIADDQVVVGLANGQLVDLSLQDGKVNWSRPIALPSGNDAVGNLVDVASTPIVHDGNIYAVSYHGNLVSVNKNNGHLNWQHPLSSFDDMSYKDGNLYITGSQGKVYDFDAQTGNEKWVQSKLEHRFVSAPAVWGNYIAVGDFAGFLHLLSRDDGSLMGRGKVLSDGISAQPVISNNNAYITSDRGSLAAVAISPSPDIS